MKRVDIASFSANNFEKGAGVAKRLLWFVVNALIVRAAWNPQMGVKLLLLRLFGAEIGRGVVIKDRVNIKSPWQLIVGDNVWLGEGIWIDNLDRVTIGSNVCISQGALLLTGNHDYTSRNFDYRNGAITLEDGVWIGARSIVCPGVRAQSHSILTVGSVATSNLAPYAIYQGNPATKLRTREIK
ncbi:MAG: WcaF family extracellular polysaccharide biosynthesis acetyltransferase [Rikenellaceae bacterium]